MTLAQMDRRNGRVPTGPISLTERRTITAARRPVLSGVRESWKGLPEGLIEARKDNIREARVSRVAAELEKNGLGVLSPERREDVVRQMLANSEISEWSNEVVVLTGRKGCQIVAVNLDTRTRLVVNLTTKEVSIMVALPESKVCETRVNGTRDADEELVIETAVEKLTAQAASCTDQEKATAIRAAVKILEGKSRTN